MIQIKNASFSYKEQEETLHEINLHVKKGECILCVVKADAETTVIKLINGLILFYGRSHSTGEVQVDNCMVARRNCMSWQNTLARYFKTRKVSFNLDRQ